MARIPKRYPLFLQLSNNQLATHDPHMLILTDYITFQNVNVVDLAHTAGISPTTIRAWRRLKVKRPAHCTLMSVALALGYNITLQRKR